MIKVHVRTVGIVSIWYQLLVRLASDQQPCVCVHGSKRTYLPSSKSRPSEQGPTEPFICQCSHICRHDSRATLQFQREKLMRQQEYWAAVGASWRGSEHSRLPVAFPHCRVCPLARPYGWAPSLQPRVCSSSAVITSSHCTTAPSHLQGGSAGHTASFSAVAMLVLSSHREGESWNSLCLLLLNKLQNSKTLSKTDRVHVK